MLQSWEDAAPVTHHAWPCVTDRLLFGEGQSCLFFLPPGSNLFLAEVRSQTFQTHPGVAPTAPPLRFLISKDKERGAVRTEPLALPAVPPGKPAASRRFKGVRVTSCSKQSKNDKLGYRIDAISDGRFSSSRLGSDPSVLNLVTLDAFSPVVL